MVLLKAGGLYLTQGGFVEAGFRQENREFSGPSSGPGTPPVASGSFCCAFWWYFQPRSSILDPFRDTQIFSITETPFGCL